jgi:hypothetical protein
MSDLYQSKAVTVVNELAKDKQFAGATADSPFIDLITQLLQQLLPMLLTCFATPKAAHSEMQRPTVFTRMRLRSTIRKQHVADDEHTVGAVASAVLKIAKATSEEEYTQLAG